MCKRLFTTTYYLQLPTKSTTYNYLSTITLHKLFTLYTFDNIGAGLWKVRIGKGGFLNVPYDILPLLVEWRPDILYGKVSLFEMTYVCTTTKMMLIKNAGVATAPN